MSGSRLGKPSRERRPQRRAWRVWAAAPALAACLAAPLGAAFEDLGSGARGPGMGNAFTAVADDLHAIHYNPAGLAQLGRPQLSASYSRFYIGLSDGSDLGLSQLLYAHPLRNGRWGTLGGSWERFSLSDVYQEQALYASWGKRVLHWDSGSQLLAGLNLKYLHRSFKQLPETFNALNQNVATGQPDPVLAGSSGKGALDADLGLLYRFPRRFQLGLLAQHLNQPDVGFSAQDKLPLNLHLGLGYKSLWMNLTGELRLREAPNGSRDKDFILGAERYFPSLDYGQFGLRGSLGFGSREWRQVTLGLSYRINKIQFDYGFLMPMGTIQGTAGTHRLAMSFHFGAPTAEEELSQDLLNQAKRMKEEGKKKYGYEFADTQKPHDVSDPQLAQIRASIDAGAYRKAYKELYELATELPPSESLIRLSKRLQLISSYYPDLTSIKELWEVVVASSARNFAYANDRTAVLLASYAASLNTSDAKLEHYLKDVEDAAGFKGERVPPGSDRTLLEELLYRVEAANNRGAYDKVLNLLQDVLLLAPENVTALERTGTTYYLLGRYQEALDVWQKALPSENDPQERKSLSEYMNKCRQQLGLPLEAVEGAPAEEPAPAETPKARPAPRRTMPPATPTLPPPDPREIERLYQRGVEHYARGEYLQATSMFMRILQLDPENGAARKALERIKRRQ